MIQVEVTPVSSSPQETQDEINEWLTNRSHARFQVLDIQFQMSSQYGYTGAMIIYDDDATAAITKKPVQLPKYRG
jgi:hypothetical protein